MLARELSSQRQSWVVRTGQHQELEPQLCNSVVHAGRTRHYAAPDRDSYYGLKSQPESRWPSRRRPPSLLDRSRSPARAARPIVRPA